MLVIVLAGCGGSDGGGDSGETSGPSTSADDRPSTSSDEGPPETTAGAPSTTEGVSLLRRRDVRPGDVAEQNKFFSGGPPPKSCSFLGEGELADPTAPTVAVPGYTDSTDPTTGTMAIGEASEVCFLNFTENRPVTLEITHDGKAQEQEVCWRCPDQPSEGFFASLPGDAVGRYDVTATQAVSGQPTTRASGQFTLDYQPEGEPLLVVAQSPSRGVASVARGTAINVGLAGFAPQDSVPLAIYFTPELLREEYGSVDMEFIAVVPVTMDSHGQRLYTIDTNDDDPRGCYALDTSPPIPHNESVGELNLPVNGFCLS